MDDANFSGRHDNMDNSESAVDSVTKLKEYLISAIREWSRVLVGKDKSRENIWLQAHAPKWWLHTYPPWRNPTGKKKDTFEELRIKYKILQEKLLSEGKFPKRWVEQTDLYKKGRYQDLFLLTKLIKLSEELREKEQELKDISTETLKYLNFSAASVLECLVQSDVSIQSEVKKLQEKLGRDYPLGSDSDNLSVENYNNNSPTVVNCGQNKKAKLSVKRTATECNTEISPKFPKLNSKTAVPRLILQIKIPENSINMIPAKGTRAALSLDISDTYEDKTIDDTSCTNREKPMTPSPDEGISSEGFISDSDSSPEIDHKNTQLDMQNDHQDTTEQTDLDLEDENFELYDYLFK